MSFLVAQNPNKPVYRIPMSFEPNIQSKQYVINLPEANYLLNFNLNTVGIAGDNVFMSCSSADNTKIYFGSYRCVFGTFINLIDNGSAHKFFFRSLTTAVDNIKNITFDNLNTTVGLYAVVR